MRSEGSEALRVDERCMPGIGAVPIKADAQPANAAIATVDFIALSGEAGCAWFSNK